MKLPRDIDQIFAREYLKDLDVAKAAERVGILRSVRHFGNALLKRHRVQAIIQAEMQARRVRLQIDADFVLSELMRQLARLTAMLGQDIGELYAESGAIKPLAEWPALWRQRLVTEIHSQDLYEYSSDGVQAGESKTWDKSGTITKIKRESTLAIEREIRATLRQIGEHVDVKAYQAPGTQVNVVVVTAERARELDAARRRLAPVTQDDDSEI